jgi:hypothetical protein
MATPDHTADAAQNSTTSSDATHGAKLNDFNWLPSKKRSMLRNRLFARGRRLPAGGCKDSTPPPSRGGRLGALQARQPSAGVVKAEGARAGSVESVACAREAEKCR